MCKSSLWGILFARGILILFSLTVHVGYSQVFRTNVQNLSTQWKEIDRLCTIAIRLYDISINFFFESGGFIVRVQNLHQRDPSIECALFAFFPSHGFYFAFCLFCLIKTIVGIMVTKVTQKYPPGKRNGYPKERYNQKLSLSVECVFAFIYVISNDSESCSHHAHNSMTICKHRWAWAHCYT